MAGGGYSFGVVNHRPMTTIQITDVEFDFEDDFGVLEVEEQQKTKDDIIGQIYEIDADPENVCEFDYEVCEEISGQCGWLVKCYDYVHIQVGS